MPPREGGLQLRARLVGQQVSSEICLGRRFRTPSAPLGLCSWVRAFPAFGRHLLLGVVCSLDALQISLGSVQAAIDAPARVNQHQTFIPSAWVSAEGSGIRMRFKHPPYLGYQGHISAGLRWIHIGFDVCRFAYEPLPLLPLPCLGIFRQAPKTRIGGSGTCACPILLPRLLVKPPSPLPCVASSGVRPYWPPCRGFSVWHNTMQLAEPPPRLMCKLCTTGVCVLLSGIFREGLRILTLGRWPCSYALPDFDFAISRLLMWAADMLVPFFFHLQVLLLILLWKLLLRRSPGRSTPLARALCIPCLGIPMRSAQSLALASPSSPILSWQPLRKPAPRRRFKNRGNSLALRWFLCVLGFTSFPTCVWAAPSAVVELSHALPAILTLLPEPMPAPRAVGKHASHAHQLREALQDTQDVLVLPDASSETGRGDNDSWYGVSVYAKHLQAAHFGLRTAVDASLAGVVQRTLRAFRTLHPGLDQLLLVKPQRRQGCMTFIAFPSESVTSETVHVLVDLTAFGGHIFADTTSPRTIVMHLLEGYYGEMKYDVEEMSVKVGATFQHRAHHDQLAVEDGDLVLVLPNPTHISWIPPPIVSLGPSEDWLPLWQVSGYVMPSGVALWMGRRLQALPSRHVRPDMLSPRIAQLSGILEPELHVRVFTKLGDLDLQGEHCNCVIVPIGPDGLAALADDRCEQSDLQALALVDARAIGRSLVVAILGAGIPSLRHCAAVAGILPSDTRRLRLCIVATLEPDGDDDFRCFHVQLNHAQEPFQDFESLLSIVDEVAPADCLAASLNGGISSTASRTAATQHQDASSDSSTSHDVTGALRFIRFLVLGVGHTPRPVELLLSMPSDTRSALNAVEFELDDSFYRCFSLIVPIHPQPAGTWGLVLALPGWARDEPIGVLDLLGIDGRIFAAALPPRLSRAGLLRAVGYDPSDEIFVFPFDSTDPLGDHDYVPLRPYGLITFKLTGTQRAAPISLEDTLADPERWDISVELPCGAPWYRANQVCIVLPDTFTSFMLAPGRRQHYHDDLSQTFGIPAHWLTVHSAKPPVRDALYGGAPCKGVAALCDHFPNIPCPPRRPEPFSFAVLLDCRPVLLGWQQWIVTDGDLSHTELVTHYEVFAPENHQAQVEGAELEGDRLLVVPGQVLLIQYVPLTPRSHNPGPDDDSDGWEELGGSSSSDAASHVPHREPGDAQTRPPDRSRSRSTRGGHGRCVFPPAAFLVQSGCVPLCTTAAHMSALIRTPIALGGILTCVIPTAVYAAATIDAELACRMQLNTLPTEFWTLLGGALAAWTYLAPLLHKLLSEPCAASGAFRDAIAFLRYAGPRLGQEWRYLPPPGASFVASDSDIDLDDEMSSEDAAVHFAICAPGYAVHTLTVDLRLPATVPEAINLVRAERSQEWELRLPFLTPARPQPCPGIAVLIAAPRWAAPPHEGLVILCLDTSRIDNRLFAAVSPSYVDRLRLLQLADLPLELGIQVFLGSHSLPVVDGHAQHVVHGDTFVFVWPDEFSPVFALLEVALLDPTLWREPGIVPSPVAQDNYVLLHEADTIVYTTSFPCAHLLQGAHCSVCWSATSGCLPFSGTASSF